MSTVPELSRFAYYEVCGTARDVLKIGTRPTPKPGEGMVLVKIRVSGINPSDTKRRSGWAGSKPRFTPTVLHSDGAGVIAAVGPGIDPARVGERVWLWNAESAGQGTAADYCVVPAAQAVPLPDEASFEVGACLGVPACTAHRAVFADGPVTGRTVLVHGAAGAVGAYAIQLARQDGARVLATASSPAKRQLAVDLGAEIAFDYRDPDAADRILAASGHHGVDRIIEVDLGENLALDIAVAAVNGTIAAYSSTRVREFAFPYYAIAPKGLTFQIVQGHVLPEAARAAAAACLDAALRAGRLTHRIGTVLPFDRIVEAHETAEAGTAGGKVLLAFT